VARTRKQPVPPSLNEIVTGAHFYGRRLTERLAELQTAVEADRHTLTMIEVARDEMRAGADLLDDALASAQELAR